LAGAIAAQASYGAYIISTDIANSGSNTSGTAFADLLGSNATSLATNFAAFTAQLVASGGIFNSTISGLDSAIASGESALLSFDNGTGSVVVRFVNTTTTANTVLATELSLVGVFTNTVLAAA